MVNGTTIWLRLEIDEFRELLVMAETGLSDIISDYKNHSQHAEDLDRLVACAVVLHKLRDEGKEALKAAAKEAAREPEPVLLKMAEVEPGDLVDAEL
jgi:hypothetical protein